MLKPIKITLHDGSHILISHSEWFAVVNCKIFDDEHTEIIRITRHTSELMTRVYAMRSVGGIVKSERNEIVLQGGDVKAATQRAVGVCGLSADIATEALSGL